MNIDSADLYAACQSDDAAVQTDAYTTLWTYLYRIALHIVRDQPAPDALAQSCAQNALLTIHQRLDECREPAAFRSWCRRIVSNVAIDLLRKRKRLVPLEAASPDEDTVSDPPPRPDTVVLEQMALDDLRRLLEKAPISERSFRVVVGRYLDNASEEELAETESDLAGREVLPSHIQVTRSKNIAKLRKWELLRDYFGEGEQE